MDADPPPGMRLRVASYNVHGCIGADGRYRPGRILGVLGEIAPDVVGLQEVDSRHGPHADSFAALEAGTGLHAVAGPNIRSDRGQYGNLLLSRWPALRVRRLDLSVPGREPRGALDVDLDTRRGMLRVLVIHLGLRRRERHHQIARLREALTSRRAPVTLVLGDFNVARWQGPDLFGAPGPRAAPRTFPSRLPLLALDRMQSSPACAVSGVHVHASPLAREASDHLPLAGVLTLPPVMPGPA